MGILSRFARARGNPVSDAALMTDVEPAVDGTPRFLLTEEQIRDRPALRQLVDEIAADGGTYHQLNLRPDLCAVGDYDMRRYVDAFHVPDDLTGLTVLDVGTAAGYFALECARRGGDVVAMDLWDAPAVVRIAKAADLPIRYVKKNIYDLDASFGQFDLVVCGSLLLHLPDLCGAVSALRNVCRGRLCVSTACPADSGQSPRPICDFVAAKADDGNYYTYWLTSEAALRQMLLVAGFARVANEGHFVLTSNEGRYPYATRHVVMTAFVE
jgi:SAM-dependent methyltransferase